MWYLRAFEKGGDRLIVQLPLNDIEVDFLRELWERPADDPMHYVYSVSPQGADALASYVDHEFDFEKYDYFVDREPD